MLAYSTLERQIQRLCDKSSLFYCYNTASGAQSFLAPLEKTAIGVEGLELIPALLPLHCCEKKNNENRNLEIFLFAKLSHVKTIKTCLFKHQNKRLERKLQKLIRREGCFQSRTYFKAQVKRKLTNS